MLILCNCPSQAAEMLVQKIMATDLAASVNLILGTKRSFREKQSISTVEETMLFVITSDEKLEELMKKIVEIHPSEAPSLISLHIYEGNSKFMRWMENNLYS